MGDPAHLGVMIFFVLSGFLITSRLMAQDESGQRSPKAMLGHFFGRRAMRILPPCAAYVFAVWSLSLTGALRLHPEDMSHVLTASVNLYADRSWYLGHLWSLSIEEQFYVLWPLVFCFAGRRGRLRTALGVIALAPLARIAAWQWLRGTPYQDLSLFPLVADGLATGCALALLRSRLEGNRGYLFLFRPPVAAGLLLGILVLNRWLDYTIVRVFGASLMNLSIAILIHRSVASRKDVVSRVLNWRPVALLGSLSYSLYLWQQLFLNRESGSWASAFPQNILLAVVLAVLAHWAFDGLSLPHRRRVELFRPAAASV